MLGQECIAAVGGPLARSVEDLELFFQTVSNAQPWLREPMHNMPWNTESIEPAPKLIIGVMSSDLVVTPHPYILRVLLDVVKKLKTAGHERRYP